MTIATFTSKRGQWSDADYQDWTGKLLAAIVAVGFVQTNDTGQLDPVTATEGQVGYWMFAFNDAMQVAYPLFIKLTVMSGSALGGGANDVGFAYSIGKATDGAGNLINEIYNADNIRGSSANSDSFVSFISSGDGSMLCMALFQNDLTGQQGPDGNYVIMIDRSRDGQGIATGVGVYTTWHRAGNGPGNSIVTHGINYASGHQNYTGYGITPVAFNIGQNTSFNTGSATPVFKGAVIDGDFNIWTPRCHVVYADHDLGHFNPTQIDGLNNYLPLGYQAGGYADMSHQQYATYAMAWW